jgi:hypothetical protein
LYFSLLQKPISPLSLFLLRSTSQFSAVFLKESGWSENRYCQAWEGLWLSGSLLTSRKKTYHAGLRVSNRDSAFSKSAASFRLNIKNKFAYLKSLSTFEGTDTATMPSHLESTVAPLCSYTSLLS